MDDYNDLVSREFQISDDFDTKNKILKDALEKGISLEQSDFYPDILEIRFPGDKTNDTLYNIKRDATVSVILQGSVKTNIDYTIDLSNPENTEGEN